MDMDKHGLETANQKLDWLINQWCERKALCPLKFILQVYPGPLLHRDQIGDLLEKLRDIKGLCRSELTSDELGYVISVTNEIEASLKHSRK
jgi:hypothetical protein